MSLPTSWTSAGQNFSKRGHVPVVADGRDVVVEGVEPDVDRVLRVARDGDAPLDRGPGDAQVPEPAPDEARDLVEPALRPDEFRMLLVELEKPVLVGREPEEVGLLGHERRLLAAVGAGLAGLGIERHVLREKVLVGDAVPALVLALVDVAFVEQDLEELLNALLVEVHGRPDEEIIGDVEGPPQVLGPSDDRIGQGFGRQALVGRGLLDLLAVFVRPRQEKDLLAGELVEAGQGVGDDGRVGVPDVGHVVDVVDRRRDEKRFLRILGHCWVLPG